MAAKQRMELTEALEHAGSLEPDARLTARALEAVPHYIWMEPKAGMPDNQGWPDYDGRKGPRMGKCTACGHWVNLDKLEDVPDFVLDDPYVEDCEGDTLNGFLVADHLRNHTKKVMGGHKHKDYGWCPSCGAGIQFRSLGYGRKSLTDERWLIHYRKSAIEAGAVVMVGYLLTVNWWQMDPMDGIEPPLEMQARELCVFRYGKGAERFLNHRYCYADMADVDEHGRLTRYREGFNWGWMGVCKSGYNPRSGIFGQGGVQFVLDARSFEDAISGTAFERVWCAGLNPDGYIDRISVMAAIAKYPSLEYLVKLGFDILAGQIVQGGYGNLLNLRGKTAQAVLKINADQWGEVKGKKLKLDAQALEAIKWAKKNKLRLNVETLCQVSRNGFDNFKDIARLGVPVEKVIKYCRKNLITAWDMKDYIRQMKQLEMNIGDMELLLPRDFNEMHTRLSQRIKHKADKAASKKMAALLDRLDEYRFSAYGLILRPFVDAAEVIDEGTALKHCVGGYVSSYAAGQIVLCCLRDESAPAKPLYTVEFGGKDMHRIQCRGEKNKPCPKWQDRVDLFWELYDQMRPALKAAGAKKKRRTKAA